MIICFAVCQKARRQSQRQAPRMPPHVGGDMGKVAGERKSSLIEPLNFHVIGGAGRGVQFGTAPKRRRRGELPSLL